MAMQRCGLLHLWLSSSSVQRDLASGGAASRRNPSGGSLGSWAAVVHGEEEMKFLKRVLVELSTAVPVGVVDMGLSYCVLKIGHPWHGHEAQEHLKPKN
jgi:hypothetical protein